MDVWHKCPIQCPDLHNVLWVFITDGFCVFRTWCALCCTRLKSHGIRGIWAHKDKGPCCQGRPWVEDIIPDTHAWVCCHSHVGQLSTFKTIPWKAFKNRMSCCILQNSWFHVYWGPLQSWAKSCDLIMVRTSHPKAVLWVLGKPCL